MKDKVQLQALETALEKHLCDVAGVSECIPWAQLWRSRPTKRKAESIIKGINVVCEVHGFPLAFKESIAWVMDEDTELGDIISVIFEELLGDKE